VRVGAILLWIVLHLIALGVSAAAVPLWAHHPLPREALAVHVVIALEIAGSAILWPLLFPNFSASVVAVLLVWPFMQLSGVLAAAPQAQLLLASTYVSLWLVGLAVLKIVMPSPAAARIACMLSSAFVLGGIALAYLRSEATSMSGVPLSSFGPLLGAFAIIDVDFRLLIPWLESAFPFLVAVPILTLKNRHLRGAKNCGSPS
jgi:hypothetical protein